MNEYDESFIRIEKNIWKVIQQIQEQHRKELQPYFDKLAQMHGACTQPTPLTLTTADYLLFNGESGASIITKEAGE